MEKAQEIICELEDIFDHIVKVNHNVKKCPKPRLTKGFLETKLKSLEDYWSRYQTGYMSLLKIVTREQRKQLDYFKDDVFGTCEDKYTYTKADIIDLLASGKSQVPLTKESLEGPGEGVIPQVKLPRIQLPTFSGNYEDWPTFKDLFTSLVHENISLSEVQKLYYLKLSVNGEARTLLKHIQVTQANYEQAWKVLMSRYDNKRMIVTSILKRIFNQKKMQNQTANHIKSLLDTTTECLNSLKNLNVNVDSWDPMIIYLVVQKLDSGSHKEWEEYASKTHDSDLPTLSTLQKFLETRFRTLELITPSSCKEKSDIRSYHVTTERVCPMCKENHGLYNCKEFGKMEPSQRSKFVKDNSICFNCLVPGHAVKACRLSTTCKICKRRHHSLLHEPRLSKASGSSTETTQLQVSHCNEEGTKDIQVNTVMTSRSCTTTNSTALLATAVVIVKNEEGYTTVLRALIDPGSQGCLITERAVQLLKCKRHPIKGTILGVGSTSSKVSHVVQVEILSRWQAKFNLKIKAYVVSKHLTTQIPTETIHSHNWSHLQGLTLADSEYHTPGSIDLLLGVDEYAQILQNEVIKGPPGSPCAQKTTLGWILFGKIFNDTKPDPSIMVMHQQIEIEDMLKVLWEQDTNTERKYTKEEETCEKIYNETYTRNKEGKYTVHLPLKVEPPRVTQENTRNIALKRLMQLKQKLEKNEKLKKSYTDVITEYVTLGHMEEVPDNERKNCSAYLPHHAVVREDKETTKVRVVFDASSKGQTNICLNDDLMTGPVIQEDLRSIIMRWRMHKICFTSDIEKMYRMIFVHKRHADYQRILWYQGDEIKEYRLLTVTFGTAAAPYLAIKTLTQIAEDEGKDYPDASKIIKEDFYVDDVMSGCDTIQQAIDVSKQLQTMLQKGGMKLQKWSSNDVDFLRSVDPGLVSTNAKIDIKIDRTVKALGLAWNLKEDNFHYSLNFPPIVTSITKRTILADLQRLFDPLGWLAPAIVVAKILVQRLWLEGVHWDDKIDEHLQQKWLAIRKDLKNVEKINVNRWLNTFQTERDKISLHGFSDASMHAIAAVVYCRVEKADGSIAVSIVAARTKVAPVKTVSLPRLELCGAVLLAKLLHHVTQALRIPPTQTYAWTDSSVVLSWLFGEPGRWKPFVANRVVEILEHISNSQWHHVRSENNPADVASRGSTVKELQKNTLWWQGPHWLSRKKIEFTRPDIFMTELEKRSTTKICVNISEYQGRDNSGIDFEKFESLTELKNVIAYCRRFIYYKKWTNRDNALTIEELDKALKICIKRSQTEDFEEDIEGIKKHKVVKQRSNLKSLNPYLDDDELLRVGGRLRHANLNSENKNPIILSNKNPLTLLIIADAHQKLLHGGLQMMLCYLRSRYWIIKAKNAVKSYIHKCLICAKIRAKSITQIMGDLPKVRVNPARPFLHSGVDFAGPYNVLMSRARGVRTTKSYVAIFICMSTKAIHIELVGDLTSQSFIGAFRRFVARRGRCMHIWSDQGRNFVGANKELVDAWSEARLNFKDEIANSLAQDGTQWHFIPAYSPNFGGLWESGVKSIKFHLKRIVNKNLTYEELATLLCQIESCLNSRPLSPIDDTDVETIPLTPGHFLIGESPVIVPAPDLREVNVSHLARWQYTQKLLNDFWHRWSSEYLTRLQQRPKWLKKKPEFDVGDIVLVKQDNIPPGKWLMGRITAKHPGPDNCTRVYSVKSGDTITKRSVSKLCYLPIDTKS